MGSIVVAAAPAAAVENNGIQRIATPEGGAPARGAGRPSPPTHLLLYLNDRTFVGAGGGSRIRGVA